MFCTLTTIKIASLTCLLRPPSSSGNVFRVFCSSIGADGVYRFHGKMHKNATGCYGSGLPGVPLFDSLYSLSKRRCTYFFKALIISTLFLNHLGSLFDCRQLSYLPLYASKSTINDTGSRGSRVLGVALSDKSNLRYLDDMTSSF